MADRITTQTLDARVENLNRRLAASGRHVQAQGRNDYVALDEYEGDTAIRTIVVGSKREIADFLHAAIVGIDLRHVEDDGQAREDATAFFGTPASELDPAKLIAALSVIVFDGRNRTAIDPQALAQARTALGLEV